jgi:triacylglycerol lipase
VSVEATRPVLLVHGIWDTGAKLGTLRRAIEHRGRVVDTIDLVPNDGRAPIRTLARQVAARVESLRSASGHARIDLVGFSMGALVSRTYIQREGGRQTVRRFVSISGPHAGTLDAHALPYEGARDMRPGSALLDDLASDPDPWGEVEVHVLYTPFDLMIVPPRSSELRGARSTTKIPVPLHRLMILAPRATRAVAELLVEPR